MNTPAYFCINKIIFNGLRSVSNLSQNSSIKIYPNPINSEFAISNTSSDLMKFSIIDLNGQLIYQNILNGNSNSVIHSENWSRGIYMMKIEQNNQVFYQKISK